MRTNLKSRLGRASAAIAVGLAALMGVASTADAQSWNGSWVPYNGYNSPQYPYYQRSQNPGWTWGERYGAPPANTYYSGQGYYPQQQGYYARQQRFYGSNPNPQALGQIMGLFNR
ncbi:MAG: hypothetical protein J0J01_13570 [Reyranella sp.]|uniref:hypothetical protein n=1 Tax=Reyranella sp. TaxID=1929291 RepID=UPI001AC01A03|nr:hypothetical protein [Reyranella sp.]MBN9087935.1 hypothetical protein [Reyranella sp.]